MNTIRDGNHNEWDVVADNEPGSIDSQGDYAHRHIIFPYFITELTNDFVNAPSIKDIPIVDIGCGNGLLLCNLAEEFPGIQVVGVDDSSRMIAAARKNISIFIKPDDGTNIGFIKGKAQKMDLKGNSFGIALQVMLLQTINDEEVLRVIAETNRLLKLQGACYVVIPHPNPASIRRFRNLEQVEGADQYLLHQNLQYNWKDQKGEVIATTNFHVRPFEFYVNSFSRGGFVLKYMWEPKIENTEEAISAKPHIFLENTFNPMFAILKFVKVNDNVLKLVDNASEH